MIGGGLPNERRQRLATALRCAAACVFGAPVLMAVSGHLPKDRPRRGTAAPASPRTVAAAGSAPSAVATDVNAAGDIVGDLTGPDGVTRAVMWRPVGAGDKSCYQLRLLPTPRGAAYASAYALNDSGVVVGVAWGRDVTPTGASSAAPVRHTGIAAPGAVRWLVGPGDSVRAHQLAGLAGAKWSLAADVNVHGQVAGTFLGRDGRRRGFVLAQGRPPVVITAPGGFTVSALNAHGVVAGVTDLDADPDDYGPGRRLVVWQPGRGARTVYAPGGGAYTDIGGFNDAGDLAGALIHHLSEDEKPKERRAEPLLLRGDGRGAPRPRRSPGALRTGSDDPEWGGYPYGYAAVNGRGDVVGRTRLGVDPATGSAYVLAGGDPRRARRLPVPDEFGAVQPAAINDAGLVVGATIARPARAVVWEPDGRLRVLPTAPGACDTPAYGAQP